MNQELRERTILPLLIPVVAILVTEVLVFSVSRILLTAGVQGAVIVAIGMTVAIMVGAAMIAAGRRIRTSSIVGLLVVVGLATVAAGAVAMQRGPFYAGHAAEDLHVIEVGAADLAFDTDRLDLVSEGSAIEFNNADSQPHNIAIYPSETALNDPLFKGEIIGANETITYELPAMSPGEYYFHCDVHPTMKGAAVVEPAGSSADEG